ncbi:MAG: Spy/CpxP family protein refolding chaperone [Alphaproteobacteria bacterium]
MMIRKLAIVSLAALSLGAAVALAQSAPPPPGPGAGMMHHVSHADMCAERAAHAAGRLAYLEVRLNLTAEQRPLWAKWRQAVEDGAGKARTFCLAHEPKPDARPTIVERSALLEQMLTAKAESLHAAQPALAALYEALTPAQRAILNRPQHDWGHHDGWHEDGEHHVPVPQMPAPLPKPAP